MHSEGSVCKGELPGSSVCDFRRNERCCVAGRGSVLYRTRTDGCAVCDGKSLSLLFFFWSAYASKLCYAKTL